MKQTLKYLALALAAMLCCFVMTGCDVAGGGDWNIDLEGNMPDGEPSYSNNGRTITQKYVVDENAISVNGRALVAQEVTRDEYSGMPVEVSQIYAVTRYPFFTSDENGLSSLLGGLANTDDVQYIMFTYKYNNLTYSPNINDPATLDSMQIEYRDSEQKKIKVVYDGSFTIQGDDKLDSSVVYEALKRILNRTVSNEEEFKTAIMQLALQAYKSGDALF